MTVQNEYRDVVNGSLQISDTEFQKFRDLVYQRAGINLHQGKKQLVQARLSKVLRQEGLHSFHDYYELVLNDKTGNKLVDLLDRISTNHTYFFREKDHLDYLSDTIIRNILKSGKGNGAQEIRLWSAGCSSGEEPYSIALKILEDGGLPAGTKLKILATDLSTKVIEAASRGVYREDKLRNITPGMKRKYFQKGKGRSEGFYRVIQPVRDLITFRKFNLMDQFPFRRKFDVIFCRNVMIYFDRETQQRMVNKFTQFIKPGGYFIVGHSESLSGITHKLQYIVPTIYRAPA